MNKIINFFKKYWLALAIIVACFAIDLITKAIITNVIEFSVDENGDLIHYSVNDVTVIKNFFYITYTRNTGAGWSMLSGHTGILIGITIVSMGLFVYLMKDYDMKKHTYYSLGLSLMLGGLFGNFFERLFKGYVTDFLEFHFWSYTYPVFNFADMCLVAGAISLIVALLITKEDVLEFGKKSTEENSSNEENSSDDDKTSKDVITSNDVESVENNGENE